MHILSLRYVQLATRLGQDFGFRKRIIDLIDQRQWVLWERRDEVSGLEFREFRLWKCTHNHPVARSATHFMLPEGVWNTSHRPSRHGITGSDKTDSSF